MNPFERWDDWEWEKAIQELGREREGRSRTGNKRPSRSRRGAANDLLKNWSLFQKRTLLSVFLFLTVFFAGSGTDYVAKAVRAAYHQGMNAGSYYSALNEMARQAIGLGGLSSKATPVDVLMQGQFLPPLSGPVVAGFGLKGSDGKTHEGIDVESALGVKVISPYDGLVTFVGDDPQLGKIVRLDFRNGWTAVLGNLGEVFVQENELVLKGNLIGTVGLSAPLKKPWLHFELHHNDQAVDPLPYLLPSESS